MYPPRYRLLGECRASCGDGTLESYSSVDAFGLRIGWNSHLLLLLQPWSRQGETVLTRPSCWICRQTTNRRRRFSRLLPPVLVVNLIAVPQTRAWPCREWASLYARCLSIRAWGCRQHCLIRQHVDAPDPVLDTRSPWLFLIPGHGDIAVQWWYALENAEI